jgi:hypothetical protein
MRKPKKYNQNAAIGLEEKNKMIILIMHYELL